MSAVNPMTQPLSEDEVETLHHFLAECFEEHDGLPLDVAHGLIVGAVSGPGEVTVGELLEAVCGAAPIDDLPEMDMLLRRLFNQTQADLQSGDFGPLIPTLPREDEDDLPLPYGWCEGYIEGLRLHGEDTLERMGGDEQASAQLAGIMAFLMYEEEQMFDPPNEDTHFELTDNLGDAAVALFAWWSSAREAAAPHRLQ